MAKMKSPNYPALGLSQAIESVRQLWKKEKRTAVKPGVAIKAMGYSSLNGATLTRLSALKKYGLLESDGKSGVRVSQLAIRILHAPDGSEEHQKALEEAALKPDLFRELFRTHAEASDDTLKSHLVVEKGFTESGSRYFISAFRDTFALAKPSVGDAWRGADSSSLTAGKQVVRTFSWPLSEGVLAEVRLTGERIRPSHLKLLRQYLELAETAVGIKDEQE